MAASKKRKRWVVPIEASVTGYIVVDALNEEEAVDQADSMIEEANFGITEDGPSIDLDVFGRMVDKGQVFSGMALEGVAPFRKPRKTTKRATPKPKAKKTSTKKAPPKGRARGGAAAPAKKPTTKKKAAKNPSGTKKAAKSASTGRRRGVSAAKN